jgi:16S rRNA (cytosine1402-N4)-methyltransferase
MHKSVLLKEVLEALNPKDGEVFVDVTFGGGGYTKAILQTSNCKVIALDRDETVLPTAKSIKEEFGERFNFFLTPFSKISEVLKNTKVDGIVADFGVSSMQLDTEERGFSFLKPAKLDMRMGVEAKCTAHQIVNSYPEPHLAEIISKYGEERLAKKIANYIVRARSQTPIEKTTELAEIVKEAYGSEARYTKIHPATKTFQALRIYINDELKEIETLLESSCNLLKKGGRLVAVSFHSLEDGIVKDFFSKNSRQKKKVNKYAEFSKNTDFTEEEKAFAIPLKGVIMPSEEEIRDNIRSRSAKLRFGIRN